MSKGEARTVSISAGIPWHSKGKFLFEDWKKEGSTSTFARYLKLHQDARASNKKSMESSAEEEEEEEIIDFISTSEEDGGLDGNLEEELRAAKRAEKISSSTGTSVATGLLNLAKTLTGTEEEEHEEFEEEKSRKLLEKAISKSHKQSRSSSFPFTEASLSKSSLRETAMEEDAAKEETSDFISMMCSSPSTRNSGNLRASGIRRRSSKEKDSVLYSEESEDEYVDYSGKGKEKDYEELSPDSYGQFDSAQDTTTTLALLAMESVQSNSRHPAKMLQQLSTRSGQNMVLDKLESCCMGKIHSDYKRCTNMGGFSSLAEKNVAKGCDHFAAIRSKDQYQGLSELHSQLKHAASDDAVSNVIAECAEEVFDEIADLAIDAYEHNEEAHRSPYYYITADAGTEMDLSKITDNDLDAITCNYQQIAQPFAYGLKNPNAFAFFGFNSIQEPNKDVVFDKAKKIMDEVTEYFLDPDRGLDDQHGIEFAYQCAVAAPILLIEKIASSFKSGDDKHAVGGRAKAILDAVQKSTIKDPTAGGYLDDVLNDFPAVPRLGRTGGREKRTRRKRRSTLRRALRTARKGVTRGVQRANRAVVKKGLKIITASESEYLIDTIQKCSEEFATRQANKLATMSEISLTPATKNDIAQEILEDYLPARIEVDAKDLVAVLPAIGKGLVTPVTVAKYTIQVLGITTAYFLTRSIYDYDGRDSEFFRRNIIDPGGVLSKTTRLVEKKVHEYLGKHLAKGVLGEAKELRKGAKKTKKALKKHVKLKGEVKLGGLTLTASSHIPHPNLSTEDKKLEDHEREFLRRAVLEAIDYSRAIHEQNQPLLAGKKMLGRETNLGIPEKQLNFVIVIPEQRKFRNQKLRKVTTDHPYRWVFETPNLPLVSGTVNTHHRPAIHDVWVSLPSADEPDLSTKSKGRFRFRYYPRTNRLERMVRVEDTSPPVHSSYIDEEGKVVHLKTKRDKRHIYVSHTFDPEDDVSDQMLAGLEQHVPPNVYITFRRSFG